MGLKSVQRTRFDIPGSELHDPAVSQKPAMASAGRSTTEQQSSAPGAALLVSRLVLPPRIMGLTITPPGHPASLTTVNTGKAAKGAGVDDHSSVELIVSMETSRRHPKMKRQKRKCTRKQASVRKTPEVCQAVLRPCLTSAWLKWKGRYDRCYQSLLAVTACLDTPVVLMCRFASANAVFFRARY